VILADYSIKMAEIRQAILDMKDTLYYEFEHGPVPRKGA